MYIKALPELSTHKVYGFHVDSSESNPANAVTYHVQYDGKNVDNYNYSPAYMDFTNDVFVPGSWNLVDDFFIPRPCMLKYDGTVDYYLDPDDYTKKADGVTASDVANSNYGGNAMVEWGRDGKKIWYKLVPDQNDATSYTCYFSDEQIDSGFKCWAFLDANGAQIEHFYTNIYMPYNASSKLRSISGVSPVVSTTGTNMIQYAKANDTRASNEWNLVDFGEYVLINLLHILIGKSLNTQAVFGWGQSNFGQTVVSGVGNTKGLFYGTSSTGMLKTFGMENWWGNYYKFIIGYQMDHGVLRYKLTYSTADGSTQNGYVENDTSATWYLTGNTIGTNLNTFIKKQTAYTNGCLLPSDFDGSETTYYCDKIYNNLDILGILLVGNYSGDGGGGGAFMLTRNFMGSSESYITCTLSCKPLAS